MSSSPHLNPQSPQIDSLFDFSEGEELFQTSPELQPLSSILGQCSRKTVSLNLTRPDKEKLPALSDDEAIRRKKREYDQSIINHFKERGWVPNFRVEKSPASTIKYHQDRGWPPSYGAFLEGSEYFPTQNGPGRTTQVEMQSLTIPRRRLSLPDPDFFNSQRVFTRTMTPRRSVQIHIEHEPKGIKRCFPKEFTRTGSSRPRKVLRGDDEDACSQPSSSPKATTPVQAKAFRPGSKGKKRANPGNSYSHPSIRAASPSSPYPQIFNPPVNPISATNRNRPRSATKFTQPKAVPKIVKRRVMKMSVMPRKLVVEIRLTIATEHTGREL